MSCAYSSHPVPAWGFMLTAGYHFLYFMFICVPVYECSVHSV